MTGYAGGGDGRAGRLRAVMIEVTCPHHGRVTAEVTAQTSAAGPPCPTCGNGCQVYAPMLALACASAEAAPRLGLERLLQALRRDDHVYAAPPVSSPARTSSDDGTPSDPASAPPVLTAPPPHE